MPEGRRPDGLDDRYKRSSYRAYDGRLADRYDTYWALRVFRGEIMDGFVLDQLGADLGSLAILDVGCATGRLLDRLAAAGARRLAGCDLAPRIVERARVKLARRGVDADLRPADAERSLPWPDASFDAVALTGVLHHFYRPRAALGEIARMLRPGGRLVLVDPCFFPPLRQLMNLGLRIHPHAGDYRFYTPREATRMLETAGWDIAVCRRLNWWAYGIVGIVSASPPGLAS
ncbi:MAG: class I SAM-dependent methyltransferase [Candidatus Krumholzibacteriota bacterium]|nr:class I SAM-dependent methyltransferase [Candidatus Krumholzibacteriota bacterium]